MASRTVGTSMWLAHSQMNEVVEKINHRDEGMMPRMKLSEIEDFQDDEEIEPSGRKNEI